MPKKIRSDEEGSELYCYLLNVLSVHAVHKTPFSSKIAGIL
jgi:hypothetical protein